MSNPVSLHQHAQEGIDETEGRSGRSVASWMISLGLWVIAAEVIVLALQHTSPQTVRWVSQGVELIRHHVGLVWPVFVALTSAVILAVAQLAFRVAPRFKPLSLTTLQYVIEVAPITGLIQTFLNLSAIGINLDPTRPQQEILAMLTRESGEAFMASIIGLALQLTAFSAKTLFTRKESVS